MQLRQLTSFLFEVSQPITIKGWDLSQSGNLYTRLCSSSVESLLLDYKTVKPKLNYIQLRFFIYRKTIYKLGRY